MKITKTQLRQIIKEELQNLREETEEDGWLVRYTVPTSRGRQQPYTKRLKASDKATAIAKVKDQIKEEHPEAGNFVAVEEDIGFEHYDQELLLPSYWWT